MKTFQLILILIVAFTISCKENKPEIKKKVTATVKHYVCTNNCENSGANTAGNCPVCKTPYTHNVAFHNDNFLKNGPLKVPKVDLNGNSNSKASTSPAQNALGIYHYTCTKGCYGGAGTAAKCTTCGLNLVHNQVYHN